MCLIAYYALVLSVFEYSVNGEKSQLCSSWSKIEDSLKTEEFQFECKKDEDCQSLNCSGTTHGYYVNGRIQLYTCDNPPSIEVEINVPKLNVNGLKKKIHHNDSISLTKNLNVEFEVQRSSQELSLGIFVQYSSNGSFPLLRFPLRIPVVSHIGFPTNCSSSELSTQPYVSVSKTTLTTSVHTTKSFLVVPEDPDPGYSNCSITNSSCFQNEICLQTSKVKPGGICVCISSFKRDKSGICVYDPEIDISTEGPHINPDKKGTSNVSLLLTAILVPISVILILVGLVYASIHFQVFQHLRRRLRVQVYEHVLLGEDEEEEDLTNPVA